MKLNEIGITIKCACGSTQREILENIKNAGFKHVMIDQAIGNIEEGIQIAHELGLAVPFVHLNTGLENTLYENEKIAEEFIKKTCADIELCAKYGIETVVIHPAMNYDTLTPAPEPGKNALANLRKIAHRAERCKVRVAIENFDEANVWHLFYLLDHVKSPYIGFCYDSGHHNLLTPDFDLLSSYGDRLFAVHFQDNNMDYDPERGWGNDLHLLPFDGKIDFERVAEQIAESKYRGVVMIESTRVFHKFHMRYRDLTAGEFLKRALAHGERLSEMITGKL